MRLLITVASILCVLFLLIPLFVYLHPYHERFVHYENIDMGNVFVKDFQYSHWTYKKSNAQNDFNISGNVLSDQNKKFGPWQFAFVKELVIKNPHVDFYKNGFNNTQLMAGQGVPEMNVSSLKEGSFNMDTITFSQNPVITSINGRVFNCTTMVWKRASRTFNGQGDCRLQLGDHSIFAPEISVDQNLMAWHIPGNAT